MARPALLHIVWNIDDGEQCGTAPVIFCRFMTWAYHVLLDVWAEHSNGSRAAPPL